VSLCRWDTELTALSKIVRFGIAQTYLSVAGVPKFSLFRFKAFGIGQIAGRRPSFGNIWRDLCIEPGSDAGMIKRLVSGQFDWTYCRIRPASL
jgi:hypothetical protein